MSETPLSNPSRTPTFEEVLALTVANGFAEVHTNMPGRVEAYYEATQLVDVQPLVKHLVLQEDGSTVEETYPVIKNVPVKFPGANGFRITFPVTKGDEVELAFAECSLEVWKANGGIVGPKDSRRFHIADATATLGLHSKKTSWTGASTSAMTLGKDGGPQVVIRSDKIELGSDADNAPTDYVALASLVKNEIKAVRDSLDSLTTKFNTLIADLTANNIVLAAHTHAVSVAVAGPSPALAALQNGSNATGPAQVGDVKSANVLAKSP